MQEYCRVEGCTSLEGFLTLARGLGEILHHPNGELYDIVTANDGTGAKRGSFSQRFGFQEFPLHTDTAFWEIPARLLIMWSPKASNTPTTMLSWRNILAFFSECDKKNIQNAIFTVHTYERIKYSGLNFISAGSRGFRYDPNIMVPANGPADEFVKVYNEIINYVKSTEFHWYGSNALVLNNWNMLHGRKGIENMHESRTIFRIYVR
ncbi:TauD/TfdA family dioxygenase [Enterobacter asburiae]|uniref:TauD/TfdA family dioxygenase n=1 Tax=Enterobacter asburiae TaxID=61645 RepID=UPI0038968D8D